MFALFWNVRGLGKPIKRSRVRKVVMRLKPTVCFLQESKLSSVDSRIFKDLGGSVLTKGISVDVEGSAGGLVTMWNEEMVSIRDCMSNKWCIILVGELNKFKKEVVLCNVYTSNSKKERRDLWGYILSVQQSFPLPWCMGGDFNTVLVESERNGGVFNKWSAKAFNNFMLQAKVVDFSLRGGSFTWSNNRFGSDGL